MHPCGSAEKRKKGRGEIEGLCDGDVHFRPETSSGPRPACGGLISHYIHRSRLLCPRPHPAAKVGQPGARTASGHREPSGSHWLAGLRPVDEVVGMPSGHPRRRGLSRHHLLFSLSMPLFRPRAARASVIWAAVQWTPPFGPLSHLMVLVIIVILLFPSANLQGSEDL